MATPSPEADEPLGPFDIYETMDGPRHVVNPVRRLILAKMRGAELTVPQIIEATDLTKSTISTHLNVLYRQRMVAYREDPADRRRKRYYLTARHVATSRRCADRVLVHRPGELDLAAGAMGTVPRLLLRAFVVELRCSGLDVGPIVRETGRRVGELAAQQAGPARDLDGWAEQAKAFWSDAGLGELCVVDHEPLTFEVADCTLCCQGDDGGVGLCNMAAGIMEGMAAEALRASVRVTTGTDGATPATWSNGAHGDHAARGGHRAHPTSDADTPAPAGVTASGPPGDVTASARCGCRFAVHVETAAV